MKEKIQRLIRERLHKDYPLISDWVICDLAQAIMEVVKCERGGEKLTLQIIVGFCEVDILVGMRIACAARSASGSARATSSGPTGFGCACPHFSPYSDL